MFQCFFLVVCCWFCFVWLVVFVCLVVFFCGFGVSWLVCFSGFSSFHFLPFLFCPSTITGQRMWNWSSENGDLFYFGYLEKFMP